MKKLSKEQILMLHTQLIQQTGGSDGVRDYNLLDSALETPFQSFEGDELYPTIQAKAARLGYGPIKNHCMIDGNKRIGATIFLYFLNQNNALYKNGKERINNDALATLTILVASSRPEDKEIMIQLIKTIIK